VKNLSRTAERSDGKPTLRVEGQADNREIVVNHSGIFFPPLLKGSSTSSVNTPIFFQHPAFAEETKRDPRPPHDATYIDTFRPCLTYLEKQFSLSFRFDNIARWRFFAQLIDRMPRIALLNEDFPRCVTFLDAFQLRRLSRHFSSLPISAFAIRVSSFIDTVNLCANFRQTYEQTG